MLLTALESAGRSPPAHQLSCLDPDLFAAIFDALISAQRDPVAKTALLIAEIRGFSEELDLLSAEQGDEALASALQQAQRVLPPSTMATRLGRETFALAIPDVVSLRHVAVIACRLVERPLTIRLPQCAEAALPIRAGVALAPYHGSDFQTVLASAELALLELAREGGTGCRVFEPHLRRAAADRSLLRRELVGAFRNDQFELFFQPQVDLAGGTITGCEALLRWRHPERGLLAPAAFIAELESMPLAEQVERWVVDRAVAQAARWQTGAAPIRVSVNLFPRRLSLDLVRDLGEALERHSVAPRHIELEVTERHALADLTAARATIDAARRLGLTVALDDFGTGFATFTALRGLEVDRIKVDRSFVKGVADNAKNAAIVAGVATLAQRLAMTVVAEGIETDHQRALVLSAGCIDGQGALFGMPMPATQLTALLDGPVATGSRKGRDGLQRARRAR